VPQGREIFGRLTVEENLRMGLARFGGKAGREIPASVYEMFPVLYDMRSAAAATCPAASSSNWPLAGRWSASLHCWCWMNPPRASSPPSSSR
jgi:hypothetical protein